MLSHMAKAEKTESSRMGFLLAGGKSSRMGVDKALLEFGGETLLARALSVMGTVCGRRGIVGDPTRFERYESATCGPVVADIFPGCGPLGGIHAALVHSSAEFNLILAVDMPFVTTELLTFLFATAEAEDNRTVITVPRTSRGLQPLCAVYRREFSVTAEQALRAGEYKVDAAFSSVPTRVIGADELAAAAFPEQCFFNMNTPQDRRRAEERGFRLPS
jgi:molybdopterin-guanine dinucleotide biosynthesis protein A